MDIKLTLSLDQMVVERAEKYAQTQGITLSKLVESYLEGLPKEDYKTKSKVTPLVESLSGVIDIPDDFDEKEFLSQQIMTKHK